MKKKSLHFTQIIYSLVVVFGVIFLSLIISVVLLRSVKRTTEDKISYFIAADAHQMELNVNSYLNNVQQVTALLFSDKNYYLYDSTDTSLSDYQKIQNETLILNRIVDLGMMNSFCDFGIVYPNDKSTGWISQVTNQMFKDGGIYSYFSSAIPGDNLKQDAWIINVMGNSDRIYYVKRLNPNAVCVVSFYISELENVLAVPSELSDMTVRLVTGDNLIIYSTNDNDEEATQMDPSIADIIGDNVGITAINDEYLITSNKLSNGWKVVCSIPTSAIMADQVAATRNLIVTVLLITILVVLTMLLITSKLNYSVKGVVDDLDYKARNDQMTGLLNKSTFRTLVESDLEAYNGKQAIAFLMFDLDNFKKVNDVAGHKFGDDVIKRMGALLRDVFDAEEALIGRIGGDEFAVYKSYHDISRDEADKRIHDLTMSLYEKFEAEFKEESDKYLLTVSSGILVTGPGEHKFDDLYQKTDVALYISKRNGKSKPTFI
ncbi:diguanylate cyclase (GGDEF) domain-containing protein [Ruminococcaceae bacterium YRB3002]|nr:diguanylate cyclase (GGDEF) domain-containing protein [Ruminococcaceae bacterium YRB3002]